MRKFCTDVEADKAYCDELKKKFQNIVDWYEKHHKKYAVRLREWLGKLYVGESYADELTLDEAKNTVEFPSDNIEVLSKIILSLYSKGPRPNKTWMKDFFVNFSPLIEILNQTLKSHNEVQNLDLGVLLETRDERNGTTHRNDIFEVSSIIRQMNVFREMLIFVDPTLNAKLAKYDYPNSGYLDIGALLSDDNLNPEERTLVLIAGSLHDIESEKRALLANLPWTMVIDLDAASSFGGLRSSVNDDTRILDKIWGINSINKGRTYSGNYTEWYSCGDLINIDYYDKSIDDSSVVSSCITKRTRLSNSNRNGDIEQDIDDLFYETIKSLNGSPNPITMVFISSKIKYAKNFMTTINREWRYIGYSFLGVYYHGLNAIKEISTIARTNYPQDDLDTFNFFRCDLQSFFDELWKYKEQLPVLKANYSSRTLPSKEGPMSIEKNLSQTLESFSDVLYSDCGSCDPEESQKNKEAFYKGGQADWSVVASHDGIVPLFKREFDAYTNQIKNLLEKATANNKVVVYHQPGVGGSTFVRQLGYCLHDEYPVVYVLREYRKTEISKMASALYNLYDNLKKGILIIADNMDTGDVENLSDDLASSQSRPFCILISQRAYDGNKMNTLGRISDSDYSLLKTLYYNHSPLSKEELHERHDKSDAFFTFEKRVPFLIALYYFEKDFIGIADYVEKTILSCKKDMFIKVIGYAALLNIYNPNYPLPNNLAAFLSTGGINTKTSFLKKENYANSLLIKLGNGITTKHYLISEEILRQTAMKLYKMKNDSNYKSYLHSFASDFIDDYFYFLSKNRFRYNDEDNALIKGLFINSKEGDDKFSRLIEDIDFNDKSESVLKKLVYVAENYVESCADEEDRDRLYNGLAHFYGHLGRFYQKDGNPRKNTEMAIECAKKAVKNMRKGNGNDYRIYHMCGVAYQKKWKEKFDNLKYAYNNISSEEVKTQVKDLEDIFLAACDMFDTTVQYGGYQYGYLSELEFYIDIVKEMYIDDGEQRLSLLDQKKKDLYIGEIGGLFDMVSTIELDDNGNRHVNDLRDKFKSCLVHGKDEINYYQGLVDSARSNNSQETLFKVRFGLLYARLRKWENLEGADKTEESNHIMSLLDEICSEPEPENSREKFSMVSAYNKWLYFARLNSKSLSEGINIAERWAELSEKLQMSDPRPYYNWYVLKYLEAMDGYSNQIGKAEEFRSKCSRIAEAPKNAFGKKATVRDILIDGRGMGRLYPCTNRDKIPEELSIQKVWGIFDHTESKMGIIDVTAPKQWKSCKAKFALTSRTTLREEYTSHDVEFYGAFTYEQMVAYNGVVADITSGETLETQYKKYYPKGIERTESREVNTINRPEKHAATLVSGSLTRNLVDAVFYPNYCFFNSNDRKYYLNGIVKIDDEESKAGFPMDLLKNIDDGIADFEAEANKIINAKGDCGFPVKCFKRQDGNYGIDIEESVSDYNELIERVKTTEPAKQPLKEEQASPVEKVDYSYLNKKEGKFTPTGKKNKKTLIGHFECDGKTYDAIFQCDGAKVCADIIKKGSIKARVNSTASGKIIVKPLS